MTTNAFFVLTENGVPVAVARADRLIAAYAWQAAAPGRAIIVVSEVR